MCVFVYVDLGIYIHDTDSFFYLGSFAYFSI